MSDEPDITNFAWRNRDLSLKIDNLERKLEIAVNALKSIQHLCNQSVHPVTTDLYSITRQALLAIEEPKKVEPKPIFETETPKKRGRPRTSRALF